VDAYVFIREATPGTIDRLKEYEEVRYLAYTTGPFAGFVKVEVGNLEELRDLVHVRFADEGVTQVDVAVASRFGMFAPRVKLVPPPPPPPSDDDSEEQPQEDDEAELKSALVRVRTEPGRADEVLDEADQIEWIHGSAVVAGSFDVLLVAWGETPRDVLNVVTDDVSRIPGIVSTTTMFLIPPEGGTVGDQPTLEEE
jgi:DNA-binding Lrp family transcriptional regulator